MTSLYDGLFSVEMSQKHNAFETLSFTLNDVFKLKKIFEEEINSKRRFEEISTLEELYNVLEDRNALTDNVLLELEPKFRDFVYSQRKRGSNFKELILPKSVVRLINENFSDDWETLGECLKISEEQKSQCQNVEDVLMSFKENCKGISPQEMTFRLNRGLEMCGKGNLKSRIVELMKTESF